MRAHTRRARADGVGRVAAHACRALPAAEREALLALGENAASRRTPASYFAVTNVHLSDLNVAGELDALVARCASPTMRLRGRLDLVGGRLTGPIRRRWLGRVVAELTALDLSQTVSRGAIPRSATASSGSDAGCVERQVKLEAPDSPRGSPPAPMLAARLRRALAGR